ncbi:MAG: hypothetical protein AAGH83_08590 [Pseudomonadota bacterium]
MPIRFPIFAALFAALLPTLANSATFRVFTPPANTIGTFEAPLGGGLVSNLLIIQSGVLFDIRTDAGGPFTYDPTPGVNDFVGLSSIDYTNSANYPGVCGPMQCAMTLFPLPGDPFVQGDIFAIDAMMNNIDEGTKYIIDPRPVGAIPLPPAIAGLAAALGGLFALRRRRKTA